jgi:hypothetical protein
MEGVSKGKVVIAVLDRGWVFVGRSMPTEEGLRLENAACVRYWGTTRGVGQLALSGPEKATRLDEAGVVLVPESSVICVIETDEKLWEGR